MAPGRGRICRLEVEFGAAELGKCSWSLKRAALTLTLNKHAPPGPRQSLSLLLNFPVNPFPLHVDHKSIWNDGVSRGNNGTLYKGGRERHAKAVSWD